MPNTMTQKMFWLALEQEVAPRYAWKIQQGQIRALHPDRLQELCPLIALCVVRTEQLYPLWHWQWAAGDLGLDASFAREVTLASDTEPHPRDSPTRTLVRRRLRTLLVPEAPFQAPSAPKTRRPR